MPADVTFSSPLSDTLQVMSFSGSEAISETFLFDFELSCSNASLDFTQIVGQPVALTLALPSGDSQYLHGVVTAFRQGGQDASGSVSYYARVEPWFALLRMNVQQQIFQNKTVPDILKAVFSALSLSDFKDATTGTYPTREYCVQYGETTYDFLSRLMESEGIFYFFTHTASAHTLVLADDSSAFAAVPGAATLQATPSGRTWQQVDALRTAEIEQRLVPVQVSSDDFNFTTPTTDLYATTSGTGGGKYASALSVYQYPGLFQAQADGETATGLTLTSLEAEQQQLAGSSASRAFHTGAKFTLAGHYRSDANAEYVLRSIQHSYRAQDDVYSNAFTAFPSANTFRPPQRTPQAIVRGAQTALVVGKSGEEIWTDQYGRIKVKFHWDQSAAQDDTASCWIRVAQSAAGQQWGSISIPRVGQEVIVQFLDGNPDRPIVTGCVYNGAQTVPYALPANQTRTTLKTSSSKGNSGNNELCFEDKAGSEQIFLQAQKDLNISVLGDQTSTIANNRSTTVSQKDDTLTISQGNRTVDVTQGNETHTVGGKRDLSVTGNESHTNQAKFTQTVAGDFALSISGNLTISVEGSVSIKSGTSFAQQAGTSYSAQAATSMSLQSDGTLESKANATNSVQGQAMVEIKGGLVKIN